MSENFFRESAIRLAKTISHEKKFPWCRNCQSILVNLSTADSLREFESLKICPKCGALHGLRDQNWLILEQKEITDSEQNHQLAIDRYLNKIKLIGKRFNN